MRFSYNWLRELCDFDLSPRALAERLTLAGFEVEAVIDQTTPLQRVLVVEVAEVRPHPGADKLKIVKVLDGQGTREIVCGAPDVKVGVRVPLAEPGAIVGDKIIAVQNVRGVESPGMLCSERELGISDDHGGLCALPGDWPLGKALSETALADTVFEVNVTPNRPDVLCHVGLAREVAALVGGRIKRPRVLPREEGGDVGERVTIEVLDQNACRRYVARVVTGVRVGPSALPVRARLFSLGIRPINNVVDATNYAMLELGLPLHAFDLGRLVGNGKRKRVVVRKASAGEVMKTLDGATRALVEDDLLITDGAHPIALAGVMGGLESEIADSTSDVLIEAAHFEPQVIHKTSRRLGLATEAANRFWRGADIEALPYVNERTSQLMAEWSGGKVCRGAIDVYSRRRAPVEVPLRPKRVSEYLGVSISVEDLAKFLSALELNVKGRTEQAITFGIPSFRLDLTSEVDLIEEVARLYGYHLIPERLPEAGGAYHGVARKPSHLPRLLDELTSFGLSEAVNYSFVSEKEEAQFHPPELEGVVRLQNPMSEAEAVMRTSLIPSLLKNARHNISRDVDDVRVFEIGRVYYPRPHGAPVSALLHPRDAQLPVEEQRLAVLLSGPAAPFGWGTPVRHVDFFDIKRVAQSLFESRKLRVEYRAEALGPFMHPHASASIYLIDVEGGARRLGLIGQLHPQALESWDIKTSVFVLDVALAGWSEPSGPIRYQPLPRFPGIRRDLALIVPLALPAGRILDFLWREGRALLPVLEDIRLFDVYQGAPIKAGHASLAFAFFFRHHERTLTDDEVQAQFFNLIARVKAEFAIELREG